MMSVMDVLGQSLVSNVQKKKTPNSSSNSVAI